MEHVGGAERVVLYLGAPADLRFYLTPRLAYSEQEGETGFTVARQSLSTSSFGLRAGVGVVVFF
jgi:hypothetical protein